MDETPARYVEILGMLPYEFTLEPGACWDVHHIVSKQAMDDKVFPLDFHENCLFTFDSRISIPLHPLRDMGMPSPCCLLRTIDTF